jgi:hypothetical protein
VFLEHINLSLCEHATIADQHHPRQTEPLRQCLDLVGDGLGITGVAGIDLDGDGSAVGVGEQAVDDDRQAGLAIAVVAEAGQRAGLALAYRRRSNTSFYEVCRLVPALTGVSW